MVLGNHIIGWKLRDTPRDQVVTQARQRNYKSTVAIQDIYKTETCLKSDNKSGEKKMTCKTEGPPDTELSLKGKTAKWGNEMRMREGKRGTGREGEKTC